MFLIILKIFSFLFYFTIIPILIGSGITTIMDQFFVRFLNPRVLKRKESEILKVKVISTIVVGILIILTYVLLNFAFELNDVIIYKKEW